MLSNSARSNFRFFGSLRTSWTGLLVTLAVGLSAGDAAAVAEGVTAGDWTEDEGGDDDDVEVESPFLAGGGWGRSTAEAGSEAEAASAAEPLRAGDGVERVVPAVLPAAAGGDRVASGAGRGSPRPITLASLPARLLSCSTQGSPSAAELVAASGGEDTARGGGGGGGGGGGSSCRRLLRGCAFGDAVARFLGMSGDARRRTAHMNISCR